MEPINININFNLTKLYDHITGYNFDTYKSNKVINIAAYLLYRVWNAAKHIFGRSDWDVAKNQIKEEWHIKGYSAEIDTNINGLLCLKLRHVPAQKHIDFAKKTFLEFKERIEQKFVEEREKPKPGAFIFISPFQVEEPGKPIANPIPWFENLIPECQKALTAFHDLLQVNGYNVLKIHYSSLSTKMITSLNFKIAVPAPSK